MNRLKAQKSENGGNVFDFETSKGMEPFEVEVDSGFTGNQRRVVDDMEEVGAPGPVPRWPCSPDLTDGVIYLAFWCVVGCKSTRCGDFAYR